MLFGSRKKTIATFYANQNNEISEEDFDAVLAEVGEYAEEKEPRVSEKDVIDYFSRDSIEGMAEVGTNDDGDEVIQVWSNNDAAIIGVLTVKDGKILSKEFEDIQSKLKEHNNEISGKKTQGKGKEEEDPDPIESSEESE